jgi:hypothetical protein
MTSKDRSLYRFELMNKGVIQKKISQSIPNMDYTIYKDEKVVYMFNTMNIAIYPFKNSQDRAIVCVTINGPNLFYFVDKGPKDMISKQNPDFKWLVRNVCYDQITQQ